ncbi:phage minor head protein [Micromonospora sp. NPDC049836]|uniref:phage minor head protein n=1 Tax=Micromonospora sp. NPDC049836 TaxID=3364274 RepID=UPI00379DE964
MAEPDPWLPLRLDHEARVVAAERRMLRAARAALRAWLRDARAVTLPVTAAALPPDPSALSGAGQAWFEAMTVHLLPAAEQTFLAGVADGGGDVELLRVAQMKDEYLAALPNRLAGVPDSAWQLVVAAVAELTGEGASVPRIRDAIEVILGERSWEDRAVTIARTETIGAYNAGTLTAWLTAEQVLDEKLDKVWVATHDERTRHDHRDADGQRVALDGVFMVGGAPMRYPGDPAAPPGQTVNCRCTMIEVEADEPLPVVPKHPWPRRDRATGLDITVTAAAAAKGGKQMATWKGTLAPLGAKSGDRRIFAADGEWSFRELPLALRWAREDAPGHEGAVTIGRITTGEVQKTKLVGAGDFIDAVPELGEALELLRQGVLFPSVDLDDFEFVFTDADGKPIEEMSDEEWEAFMEAGEEPYITVTKGRVMAVTLVGTQAFMEAKLELVDDEPADGEPSDEAEPSDQEEEPVAAAGAAAKSKQVAPLYPPTAWFDDPGLTELTPITVTADGRVFGHLADRDCHLSFLTGGQCVLPPDEGGFDWFHRPEIQTAEGDLVAVGHITAATGHADLSASAAAAVEHYDDTGTQVAVVRAGRDAYGTWVAGSLVPEATEEQVQLLRRSPLSGDWRWIGGARQLVAALCVNVGGFPVVRGRSAGGRAYAMVASGWTGWHPSDPDAGRRPETPALSPAALDAAVRRAVAAGFAAERQRVATATQADRIAASIGRDRKTLVAALTATVHGK